MEQASIFQDTEKIGDLYVHLRFNGSRRRFLSNLAMTAGAAATMPRLMWAEDEAAADAVDLLDPRVKKIVAKTIGIDTHNHIDVPMTAADQPGPDVDMKGAMKRSGLAAICMTFATDYQRGDAYDRFHKAMDATDRLLDRNGIKRSFTAGDVRSAHKNDQPTVVQSIEGAHFLDGHIERVEEAYRRGMRHFGLLHDSDANVPLGDVYTNPVRYNGLTPFGTDVVKECNRLGMLVDMAHANMQTTEAAIRVSKRPVIVSHTGLDTQLGSDERMAQMMRPRLISKEQAKLVADAGGAIGVWTHLAATPLEFAKNLRAMVDVIGVDHVCIGTDTKLTPPPPRPAGQGGFRPGQQHARIGELTNEAWADQKAGFYYVVVDAMLKTGFTADEIGRIGGGNYLRLLGDAAKR